MLDFRTETLNAVSVDLDKVAALSNIGEIGIAIDYSNNNPANEFQNRFPLVDWLLSTPQARMAQGAHDSGRAQIIKDKDGVFQMLVPFKYGTTLPESTANECCWIPLNLAKCGDYVPFKLLCLKDCYPILEKLIYDKKRFQSNDLINYFQREGETVNQARERMAKESMAWFTAHTIILGTQNTSTNILKPFHGLLEVLEGADVLAMTGTNILSTFEQLGCRFAVMGDTSNVVFAVHPLTYEAIARQVVKGQFGDYPEGWTRNGDEISYKGHRFIKDKMVPVDLTKATGEMWVLDGNFLGGVTGTGLIPSDNFTREQFTSTNNPEDGCASECKFYYNYGTVFTTDPNHLAVVSDIPLGANCVGETLNGLDLIIQPQTIVPINKQ